MTKLFIVPLAILPLGTTTAAQQQVPSSPPGQKPPAVEVRSQRPGVGSAKRTGSVTVRVTRVDVENRMLGVEDAQGRMQAIQVGDSVQRLDEIAPGDVITAKYEQKLTLEHQPDGAAPVGNSAAPIAKRAGAESAPSGVLGSQVRLIVTVVSVDPLFRVVTLRDDHAEKYPVKAGPDIDLAKIQAGQRFLATYTETVAVQVEKSGATFPPSSR